MGQLETILQRIEALEQEVNQLKQHKRTASGYGYGDKKALAAWLNRSVSWVKQQDGLPRHWVGNRWEYDFKEVAEELKRRALKI